MNKYHAQNKAVDGIVFDSKKEADRYTELKLLQLTGQITGLERQVSFELLPKQPGERAVTYRADFVYKENGKTVAEDVKGMRTRGYVIKRKLFKLRYPDIEFREV